MKLSGATEDRRWQVTGSVPSVIRLARFLSWLGVVTWWLCLKAFASRWVYLLHYGATSVASPRLEVMVPTPLPALLLAGILGLTWIVLSERIHRAIVRSKVANSADLVTRQQLRNCLVHWLYASAALFLSGVPWLISIAILWQVDDSFPESDGPWGPTVWQPLWHGAFSGLAADQMVRAWFASKRFDLAISHARPRVANNRASTQRGAHRSGWMVWLQTFSVSPAALVLLATLLCAAWWWVQSEQALARFMLGFNDCGHFAQRVANTAAGRGWLLETPVLRTYWDHFNPGLALLAPLWLLWPSVSLVFMLQAVCLSGCALLIMRLARLLGASEKVSGLWAMAWLLQPVLGQMNLGYSYGWHPITLAIPLLLLTLCAALQRRFWQAAAWLLLACSFEDIAHPNNPFAHLQLESIRRKGTSVLATGRFATHLVGAIDLETVGQFIERREQLSKLTPGRHPLLRYQNLILDRLENFQQRREQTAAIEHEARAMGFRVLADEYDIVVLTQ